MSTYKTLNKRPRMLPAATIYLDGLLCLSFDQANKATIGVNNVRDGHEWKFSVVEQGTRSRRPVVDLKQERIGPSEFHIDVTGGATGGGYVYNPISTLNSEARRFNLESHWIDLEGPRGHDQPVKNDSQTLWPRFYINEGLFCASKLSTAKFDLRNSNALPLIKPLGQIALEIVVDIFLDTSNPKSRIEIKLPGQTVSLNNAMKYQIFITNDCASTIGDDIDFPLHYKAFSGVFGSRGTMKVDDQFQLVYHNKGLPMSMAAAIPTQTGEDEYYATDKAPCMGIVLGQTRAFNA